jgi:glycosyltransferase involved in cell wall biosynthesis
VAAPFLPPFIEALQSHGVRTIVYTQDRPGDKKPVVDVPISWFPWRCSDTALSQLKPYVPTHLWSIVRLGWSGRRHIVPWLQQHQVDLCLAAWAVPSGYFAYYAKKVLGIPYCVWALGSDIYSWAQYPLLQTLIRHILQHADGLFADGIDLSNRVHKLSGRPCAFLPSVRPLTEDVPATTVEVDPTQTNFLFVGRWEKIKGIDVLIEAMKLLRHAGITARLYVVGKGSLKGFLEQKIRAYSLTDTVFLREDVPTATLLGYLQQCDCLVIPSRSESIPLVFSEGLHAKIPMIVSATGDLPTLVQRFALGYIVPPDDPVQLKQALEAFTRSRHSKIQDLSSFDEAKALFNLSRATADFLRRAEKIVYRSSPVSFP